MPNLREIVGRSCVSHNLGMAEWSERDVDRVAALGAAGRVSEFGADVFRWMYADDAKAAVRVLRLLVKSIRIVHPMPYSFAEGIAKQAMTEFHERLCRTCNGRGTATLRNGVRIVCDDCEGTGQRRYSNTARVRGAGFGKGVSYWRVVEKPLALALNALREADAIVNALLARELGRGQ